MSERIKNKVFSLITFFIVLSIIFYSFEFFLLNSQKNLKKIRDDKFLAFNNAKEKFPNLKPYINSMFALYHSGYFPKFFSSSTFSKSDIFTCNENGYYPIIKTDRYGFYNNDKIWYQDFEEVFLGDSFTAGSCVNIEDNIISNYKKNFSDKIVINLGTPGSFPLLELIKLKEYIYGDINYKKPKKIYWLYYEGNDLRELENFYNSHKNEEIFKYLNDRNFLQNLIKFDGKRNKELNKSLDYVISLIENKKQSKNLHKYRLVHFLTFAKIRTLIKDTFFSERQNIDTNTLELFREIVKLSKEIIENNGAEFIFVYLPTIERYKTFRAYNLKIYGSSVLDKKLKYNEIMKILNNLNIKVLNIKSEIFDIQEDALNLFPLRIHHHYNAEGYKIIGNFIYSKIRDN